MRILSQIILALFCLAVTNGCTGVSSHIKPLGSHHSVRPKPLTDQDRQKLVKIAHDAIGQTKLTIKNRTVRADCSGTIRAIFTKAQIKLGGVIKDHQDNDVKAIYRYVKKYGNIVSNNPRPGDLVFFHNTYDRSRNGRMNDALTHVGMVEKVKGSTVYFVHHLGQSIIRSRMDLSMPDKTINPVSNERVNQILRRAQGPYRAYTAAELFAGYGRL